MWYIDTQDWPTRVRSESLNAVYIYAWDFYWNIKRKKLGELECSTIIESLAYKSWGLFYL